MKWSIIIALFIAVFGFIPLMGIPGAIALELGNLIASLFGVQLLCLKGDRAWPAAIFATFIWPISIPIAYFICFRKIKEAPKSARWGAFAAILFLAALLVTAMMESLARSGA